MARQRIGIITSSLTCTRSALVILLALLLTGGLLSPSAGVPYIPSDLWASLLGVFAVATPFVVAPENCSIRSPWLFLRAARRGVFIAAAWFLACAVIAMVGLTFTSSQVRAAGTADAFITMGGSLILILSFLAFETTVALAVARALGNRSAGLGTTFVVSGILGLMPLLISQSGRSMDDIWVSFYLSPLVLPFGPMYHPWHAQPAALYAIGALILFFLTLLPPRHTEISPSP